MRLIFPLLEDISVRTDVRKEIEKTYQEKHDWAPVVMLFAFGLWFFSLFIEFAQVKIKSPLTDEIQQLSIIGINLQLITGIQVLFMSVTFIGILTWAGIGKLRAPYNFWFKADEGQLGAFLAFMGSALETLFLYYLNMNRDLIIQVFMSSFSQSTNAVNEIVLSWGYVLSLGFSVLCAAFSLVMYLYYFVKNWNRLEPFLQHEEYRPPGI